MASLNSVGGGISNTFETASVALAANMP